MITAPGGPEVLRLKEGLPIPSPAPDEVLIRVAAAGINNAHIGKIVLTVAVSNAELT
jgi:NADPH:quinone reductase-like Zn-dependent oxidoreductase